MLKVNFTKSLKWLSILVADFLTMFFRELQYLPTCALYGCQLALDPTVRGTGHLHPLGARLQRGCRCFHLLSNLFRLELAMDRSKVISLSLLFSRLLQWKDPKYSLIQVRRELRPSGRPPLAFSKSAGFLAGWVPTSLPDS